MLIFAIEISDIFYKNPEVLVKFLQPRLKINNAPFTLSFTHNWLLEKKPLCGSKERKKRVERGGRKFQLKHFKHQLDDCAIVVNVFFLLENDMFWVAYWIEESWRHGKHKNWYFSWCKKNRKKALNENSSTLFVKIYFRDFRFDS